MLSPITDKVECKRSFAALKSYLIDGAAKFRRVIGWPSGHDEFTVYWHQKAEFWVAFGVGELSRYWCAYGTTDPTDTHRSLEITCEINPPRSGVDRRCGGVFLADAGGNVYLGHSGKIGGGRKGIGKSAFLDSYGGRPQPVEWPDGASAEVIVFGRIGKPAFLENIGAYLRAVRDFKADTTKPTQARIVKKNPDLLFTPEFSGTRKKYTVTDAIESECDHGRVVNALHAELTAMGIESYTTRKIDLFIVDEKETITHLIEVKTAQNTTSLYQAAGQVMLHGALEKSQPRRIVVLPANPLKIRSLGCGGSE
jgi:hypothetical protein